MDYIEIRRKLNSIMQEARNSAKPEKCILCGQSQTSFCNSHSVPQFVLRSIAENGKVLQANAAIGIETIDSEKGINNSGTFQIICRKCDSLFFHDYENEENLKNQPTDKVMAEIALKNSLIQLWKRYVEIKLFSIVQEDTGVYKNLDDLLGIKSLDIKEYTEEINFYRSITENNEHGGFQILFWKILPYKVPIAVQTAIALDTDMNGDVINNIYDTATTVRIENMHVCVFPLESETEVLAFYHKRDKKYRQLRHQFSIISEDNALRYLNWIIFKYTENYFISKSIKEIVETDEKLSKLCQECNGLPNLGMVDLETLLLGYDTVNMDEIPNFLSEEYAI